MDLILDVLAVVVLVGVFVAAGMWLSGVEDPVVTRANRRTWLVIAPLTAISAVLSAVTDAWVIAVALGLWTVLELAMGLVPDLPDRLRNRQGSPPAG